MKRITITLTESQAISLVAVLGKEIAYRKEYISPASGAYMGRIRTLLAQAIKAKN